MTKYFIKKLITLIVMVFIISYIVFFLVNNTGVDAVAQRIDMLNYSEEALLDLKQALGLDRSVFSRYVEWFQNVLKGDLGNSEARGFSIKEALKEKWPATFEIAFSALTLSTIVGIALGFISAYKPNGIVDGVSKVFSTISNSFPSYFIALILIQLFSVKLKWFPTSGRFPVGYETFGDRFPNMVLPILALSIPLCGSLIRYVRNTMLDMENQEYVKFARSKGISEIKIFFKHVLRNSLRPIVTVILSRVPILLGGSVIIDSIFCWPGIGSMLSSAAVSSDSTVMLFSTVTTALVMLIVSFAIDICTALLDPRVRLDS